jgi:outer membrane biosynthesis protein TonB
MLHYFVTLYLGRPQGKDAIPSLDEDFYTEYGFTRYEALEGEPLPSTRGLVPTLEEQREEVMNRRGWFDPRFSQRWDPLRNPEGSKKAPEAEQKPQEVQKDSPAGSVTPPAQAPTEPAPAKPEPQPEKKVDTPEPLKSEKEVIPEAPKSEKEVTPEAPKSEKEVTPEPSKSESDAPAKSAPVPRGGWPSLEQEREEAMNKKGWFDPRVSQGWDINAADSAKGQKQGRESRISSHKYSYKSAYQKQAQTKVAGIKA